MDEFRSDARIESRLDGQPIEPTKWVMTVSNHIDPYESIAETTPSQPPSFSATFEVDKATYERFVGEMPQPTYTLKQTIDLNPWHRQPTGLRARLRQAGAIIVWECRRRVLGQELAEVFEITIPNCRVMTDG